MTRLGQSSICDRDLKNQPVTEKHQKGTNLGGQACDLTLNFMSVCRHYCTVAKLTQEKAANAALRLLLEQAEQDPTLKIKMDRVKAIKEELASL